MAQIEVYADVGCPFTHVGLRRLVEHRARSQRSDVVLRVHAWPLELVNGRPLDPAFIAEEIEALRAQVAPDLFVGFDPGAFPSSSIPAMALAAHAYGLSDELGEQTSLALRAALFERGLDIGDAEVLAGIAVECGITGAWPKDDVAVRRDWSDGAARGVVGSPHFFVGGDDFFCPALHIERVGGHLRIAPDTDGFGRFLDAAL